MVIVVGGPVRVFGVPSPILTFDTNKQYNFYYVGVLFYTGHKSSGSVLNVLKITGTNRGFAFSSLRSV